MHEPTVHAARLRLDIAPARFVVLCASELAPREGIDTVILALSMLHRYHGIDAMLAVIAGAPADDDDRCTIAAAPVPWHGEQVELARLCHLAHDLGVARDVRFSLRAPPAAVDDYHAAADVFASTPWKASAASASAVADAAARALPVVGAAELVRDGVTGYLVAARDPETLCRCLARLQRQPRLARAMGAAGQTGIHATSHRKTRT